MQFIEDILEEDIIHELCYKYNKNNIDQVMIIFFIRATIFFNSTKLTTIQYSKFLINELGLYPNFIYHECVVNTSINYADNSLLNIIDNLIYRYLNRAYNDIIRGDLLGSEIILQRFKMYSEEAKMILKGKRNKLQCYNEIYKHLLLMQLYKDFYNNNFIIRPVRQIINVTYPDNYIATKSIDELYKPYYDTYMNELIKFTEKELEDYLYYNGFNDIIFKHRQLKISSGIIDLLGIDSNKNTVLVELKVVSRPKDLIWQLQSYKSDLEKIYSNIRSIVIAPPLDQSILSQISKDVEVYEFKKNKNKFEFKKNRPRN